MKIIKNVEDSLRPLIAFNKVAGVAIFEKPSGNPWPKLSFIYSFSIYIPGAYCFWYTFYSFPKFHGHIPVAFEITSIIVLTNIASLTTTKLLAYRCYKAEKNFFSRLGSVDKSLEFYGYKSDYEQDYKENRLSIFLWIFFLFLIFHLSFLGIYLIFRDFIASLYIAYGFQLPIALSPVIEINFILRIRTLGKRFERLNALLQNIATNPVTHIGHHKGYYNKYQKIIENNKDKTLSSIDAKNNKDLKILLKTVRQLHLDLCEISRQVNDDYSRQMSLQLMASFAIFTGFSYCIYVIIKEPTITTPRKIFHYFFYFSWLIVSLLKIIIVARESSNVIFEAKNTSQIANEIQLSKSQENLVDDVNELSFQIMQHPLHFTASGLIVLDFGYVKGFVGSVITCLMILIQNEELVRPIEKFSKSTQPKRDYY